MRECRMVAASKPASVQSPPSTYGRANCIAARLYPPVNLVYPPYRLRNLASNPPVK